MAMHEKTTNAIDGLGPARNVMATEQIGKNGNQ
jgi:hypothetical protein